MWHTHRWWLFIIIFVYYFKYVPPWYLRTILIYAQTTGKYVCLAFIVLLLFSGIVAENFNSTFMEYIYNIYIYKLCNIQFIILCSPRSGETVFLFHKLVCHHFGILLQARVKKFHFKNIWYVYCVTIDNLHNLSERQFALYFNFNQSCSLSFILLLT